MSKELDAIAEKLSAGGVIEPVPVREFLGWFGAQRRGVNVVWNIRQQLAWKIHQGG